MSGPLGSEGHSGEVEFRDAVQAACLRWLRRLDQGGANASDIAELGREVGNFRAMAEGRGWSAMASHLRYVEQVARQAPIGLSQAVRAALGAIASTQGPPAAPAVSGPPAGMTVRLAAPGHSPPSPGDRATPPPERFPSANPERGSVAPATRGPVARASAAPFAAPDRMPSGPPERLPTQLPARPPEAMGQPANLAGSMLPPGNLAGSMLPPRNLAGSMLPPGSPLPPANLEGSMFPPAFLSDAARQSASPPTAVRQGSPVLAPARPPEPPGTLASLRPAPGQAVLAPRSNEPLGGAPRVQPGVAKPGPGSPGVGIISPRPLPIDPPSRVGSGLPDSIIRPAQPRLLGTILGLRAFGKRGGAPESPSGEPGNGVLGLRPISKRVTPSGGSPPIPAPSDAGSPWAGGRTPPDAVPGRHSAPTKRRAKSEWEARIEGPRPALPRWFFLLGGAVGLLGLSVVATIAILSRPTKDEGPIAVPPPVAPVIDASAAPRVAPVERMAAIVHQQGHETPELHALIDTQAHLASSCRDDPRTCGRGWTPIARDALNPVEGVTFAPASADAPLPAWLQRLHVPSQFPVRDDASVKGFFDFNTKNISGRERFQAKLFDCAAYADIFDSTLVKYGAPGWLEAVVYQESGCNPRATSEVGARGLWQFMPESARAYGLRVVDDDVDERLNPIKSTDAAIHFLSDLHSKLGAWDLALAAYNMGPFGILARIAQTGGKAGFWDLAHAGLLPRETAGYVPSIEAFALILENVSRLQFSRDGKRLDSTSEVLVKPGMRLSLLARAASTNTLRIRELNPEFLRDVVPEGETSARVPDAEAHRAQTFLDAWSPDDARDMCVPEDFDWGAKPFETSRFAKECRVPDGDR